MESILENFKLQGNIRINKCYYLHFGNDIFIKYKLVDIDLQTEKERETAILERVEDGYMGCCQIEKCSILKLFKKRKIYNW
jgi:hypothetical protein